MPLPPRVLKPRHLKEYGIKLTRSQRRQLRVELGVLGISGKGARRKLAGLRRTDSGFLVRKPKQPFVLVPEKRKKPVSEKTRTAEHYRRMKHKKKKGERRSGTRGNRPRREARKQKKGKKK